MSRDDKVWSRKNKACALCFRTTAQEVHWPWGPEAVCPGCLNLVRGHRIRILQAIQEVIR